MNTTTIRQLLMAVACTISLSTQAMGDTPKKIDVPAGQLIAALKALAAQTGVEFVYSTDQLEGLSTKGVHGELTPEHAVAKLLEGTKLTVTMHQSGAVLIAVPQASSAAAAENPIPLRVAQNAASSENQSSTEKSENPEKSKSDSSGEESDNKLQEIVVTAQKRAEKLKDVPISITVLRGEELDRSTVQGVTEALSRVPGVATLVGNQGSGTSLSVRGVAANAALFNGSSPVAYYIDSVPFGLVKSAVFPDPDVYDLERIEVLRGPQGTLYGANALNGVVRILTHDANLDNFEFKARALTSSTDGGDWNYRGDAAVNVPLVPGKLAARAVLDYQNLGGWIDRPNKANANDAERRNGRLKINAHPTDELSIGLTGWFSRDDAGGPSTGDDNRRRNALFDEPVSTDYDVYGLKIGYDFPAFSLNSMTSYLGYANTSYLDARSLGLVALVQTSFDSRVFAQELTLNSTQGKVWRWTAGGMYRDGTSGLKFGVVPSISQDSDQTSKSFALFGELTRVFMDGKWEVTAGLRYFDDSVGERDVLPPPDFRADESFAKTTPRLVLSAHPSEQVTLYASYSEGFRSGTLQDVTATNAGFSPLEPDKLNNYELGAKGGLWGGRLSFDTALFYIDWTDVQQSLLIPSPLNPGLFYTVLINSAPASGFGFESAVTATPTRGLTLGVNFGWNDLTFDRAVSSRGVTLFNKGDRLNQSPEYTVGASADLAFPLGANGFKGRFSTAANYTSALSSRTIAGGVIRLGLGEPLLFARAGFSMDSPGRWTATAFIDNLNNEKGPTIRSPIAGPNWEERVRPRTYGLQVEFRY